jgi:hypothetical protein
VNPPISEVVRVLIPEDLEHFLHAQGAGAGEAETEDLQGHHSRAGVAVDVGVFVEHAA